MAYIHRLLSANEKILVTTRRHLIVLLGEIFKELLILLVLAVGFVAVRTQLQPEYKLWFNIAFAALATILIIAILVDVFKWSNEQFIVTTRRVIHSSGVFSKRVLDSSLSKINDVILVQTWAGRLYGYGTIKILTASDEVINTLDRISNPIGFKQAMLNAKADLEPLTPVGATSTSATQLLEELAQLKTKNMISETEYEEKRKEILKRM